MPVSITKPTVNGSGGTWGQQLNDALDTVVTGINAVEAEIATSITAAVNSLIAGSPGALDTLNELATALGDDPAFSATVTAALGNRVRFDAAQTLTSGQMIQALANIGAASTAALATTNTNVTSNTSAIAGEAATRAAADVTNANAVTTEATARAAGDTAVQAFAVQRANHTGTQSADTVVDGTTNKAYTAAEKTKLAGVAAGATALVVGTTAGTAADGAALATETTNRVSGDALAVKVAGDIGGTPAAPQVTATHLAAALPVAQGGTGSATQNFLDLSTAQTVAGVKSFTSAPQTSAVPSSPNDLVNLAALNANAQGLVNKGASRVATAAALPANTYSGGVLTATANGALTIDGVTVNVGDQVLVKNEATAANNGLYSVTNAGAAGAAYVLTRAMNMNTSATVPNAYSFVTAGTANTGTGWNLPGGVYTLGTTGIIWAQFSGATAYTGGADITVAGTVISAAATLARATTVTAEATARAAGDTAAIATAATAAAAAAKSADTITESATNKVMTAGERTKLASGVATLDSSGRVLQSPSSPWLVVSGSKVFEGAGGPQYRATGYNSYTMTTDTAAASLTYTQAGIQLFFQNLRANSLVRIEGAAAPGSGTGVTWAQKLTQLDFIVAQAKAYGHRLILTLSEWQGASNNNELWGNKTSAWFTGNQYTTAVGGATSYQAWVTTVAGRYATNSTVAIYDLMNEPVDDGTNTAAIVTYCTTASGWIKALAPNALVYMGIASYGNMGGHSQMQSVLGALDLASLHDYTSIRTVDPGSNNAFADARAVGKPLLIDEMGIWAKNTYSTAADNADDQYYPGQIAVPFDVQGALVEQYLRTAFSNDDVMGVLIWSAADTSLSGWNQAARYEPANNSAARKSIQNTALDGWRFAGDTVPSMAGWIDAQVGALSFPPGTQVGGPASGASTTYTFNDRQSNGVAGYSYRQTTASNAPFAAQNEIVGVPPGFRFGGSHWIPAVQQTAAGTAHSCFIVCAPTALPAAGQYAYLRAPNTAVVGYALALNASGQVVILQYATSGAPTVIATSSTSVILGRVNTIEACWDAAGGFYRIYVNGVGVGAAGTTTAATGTLTASTALIGNDVTGTAGFVGYLIEDMHYASFVSGTSRALIYSYLARRYPASAVFDPTGALAASVAAHTTAIATNTAAISSETSTARAAEALSAPLAVSSTVANTSTALTAGVIQQFTCAAGAITTPALPALSGLTVGTRYGFQLVDSDTSGNWLTVPFTAGDLSDSGASSAVLQMPEVVVLAVALVNGVKVWKTQSNIKGRVALDTRYASGPDAVILQRNTDDGTNIIINWASNWGVNAAGNAYHDPNGCAPGDEAWAGFDAAGNFVVTPILY